MTERTGARPSRPSPPRGNALAWRLYIVTGLAALYVLAWRAVGGAHATRGGAPSEPGDEPAIATPPQPVATRPRSTVWLDELPIAARAAITPPAGWRVLSRDDLAAPAPVLAPVPTSTITSAPPRVVRAPATRRLRVRTRSS